MFRSLSASLLLSSSLALPALAFQLPKSTTQVVVGITEGWDSSHLNVYLYEYEGKTWTLAGGPWQGRTGRSGLTWGRGLHPVPPGATTKREGDWRSPAGVFLLGDAWGYHASIQKHPKLPYRRITTRDLWVEDPASPHYNRHLQLDHEPRPGWELKAQMKQDDYPHSLKLFIEHNARPKPVPGAGSSIFFHIWRDGGAKPSAGCTTLPEPHLRSLLARLDPSRNPLYVLLPKPEYDRLRGPWRLP